MLFLPPLRLPQIIRITRFTAVCAFAYAFIGLNAFAQNYEGMPRREVKGTIQGVQNGLVQIQSEDGQSVVAGIAPSPNGFNFEAAVERAAVKPGMLARFTAPAGTNGKFVAPIDRLDIIMPFVPPQDREPTPREYAQHVPGIYPEAMLNPALQSPDVHVVGVVRNIDKDKLVLLCGDKPMSVELGENLRIEFHGNSLNMVAPGDQVINATVVANPNSNEIWLIRAHVRAKKPITANGDNALAMEAGKGKKPKKEKLNVPKKTKPTTDKKKPTESEDAPAAEPAEAAK